MPIDCDQHNGLLYLLLTVMFIYHGYGRMSYLGLIATLMMIVVPTSACDYIQRFFCCCFVQSPQPGLLQSLQSEESLVQQRDKLSRDYKLAKIQLTSSKNQLAKVNSLDFIEAAEKRVTLAEQRCQNAKKLLQEFNVKHPGLPPEVILQKKRRKFLIS